jgi:hypothetical protein
MIAATTSPIPRSRIEEIKARFTIRVLWQMLGLPGSPPAKDGVKFSSPLRPDKTPSCSLYDGGKVLIDWSLGKTYDAIAFLAEVRQLGNGEAFVEFLNMAGATAAKPEQSAQRPASQKKHETMTITKENPFGLPYRMSDDERRTCVAAALRLLTNQTAIESIAERRKWKGTTIRALAVEPSLGITADGKLAFLYESGLKVRWKENGERIIRWSFGKPWLWRGGYIRQTNTVYVTEGETDAITLIDSGLEEDTETSVVALPSASFQIEPWASLLADKRVIIATDSDEAGERATGRLVRALKRVSRSVERFPLEGARDG